MQQLGVDLVALAPHRFHGPKGVGVLYRNRRTLIEPLIHGGVHENELAGTENIAAIFGAGVAAESALANLGQRSNLTGELQRKLLTGIRMPSREFISTGRSRAKTGSRIT